MTSFLNLPIELRVIIYGLSLVADHILVPNPTNWERTELNEQITERPNQDVAQLSVALLGTCRKIHEEAAIVLYGRNRFRLPTSRKRCRGTVFQRYASLFRHINICFDFRDLPTKFATGLSIRWFREYAGHNWRSAIPRNHHTDIDRRLHWIRDHQRTSIIGLWARKKLIEYQ